MSSAADMLVSVIVPVFNGGRHVAGCAETVLKQTYPCWELIFVDDGSEDDGPEMVQDLASQDPRIRLTRMANSGVSAARNRGMAEARGGYVYFLDVDDRLEPDALEKLVRLAESSAAPFVLAGYLTYPAGGAEKMYRPPFFYGLKAEGCFKVTPWAMVNMIPFVWANLYRRSFLMEQKLAFAPLTIAEDVLFTMAAWLSAGKAAATGRAFYHYIRQADSAMGGNERKPIPVQSYLRYYFEVGRMVERFRRKDGAAFAAYAAAIYVIMLREKGAAVTYRRHDPVHDYAWICRANRCLRGRLWKCASKWRVGLYLARIVLYKLWQKIFKH